MTNERKLFIASCIAMATTSMIFAIRGDIEPMLSQRLALTSEQMGLIWGPAFYGFTAAALISGFIIDLIGMRFLFRLSAVGFLVGLGLVLIAPASTGPVASIFDTTGPIVVYAGFLVMGLSQGLVEGVTNPLIATLYNREKTTKLTALHAWWPGGIIIGGLAAYALTLFGASWQVKLLTVGVPSLAYLAMSFGTYFPLTERKQNNVPMTTMVREPFKPLFLVLFCCMWGTSITELAADQWFPTIMSALTGMEGILFLVYTSGIVFAMRLLPGRLVHRSPFLAQSLSCALCACGLWMLGSLNSQSSLITVVFAATMFGIGKSLLWPTMLGITAELFPKGGALCIAIMGGTGFFAIAVALPVVGRSLDHLGPQGALQQLAMVPAVLCAIFTVIYLVFRLKGGYRPVLLHQASQDNPALEIRAH